MESKNGITYKWQTFYDIDTVLSEAKESWKKESINMGNDENSSGLPYTLGWLQSSYKALFRAFEEMKNENDKKE